MGETLITVTQRTEPRMRRALRIGSELIVKRPTVEGLQVIKELDPKKPVIFAVSHLGDSDPTIAAAELSKYRKVDIASLGTNQTDPILSGPIGVIGKNRFHNVGNVFKGGALHTRFDSSNFDEMKTAMDAGRDIVIAAHKPSRNWQLPNHGGVGDVYLAQLAGAEIVPVAVDIHSEKAVGMSTFRGFAGTIRRALTGRRPEATIKIGKAIALEKIFPEDLQDAGQLLIGKRDALRSNPARYLRAEEAYSKLRQQSETILGAIAEMLPAEKRSSQSQHR